MTSEISPQALAQIHASGIRFELIDVRTPAEFAELHIEFAKNLPLDSFNVREFLSSRPANPGPLYIICRSGARADIICSQLEKAGAKPINIKGGTAAWDGAGLPVIRGAGHVMSLERQVRIAAGGLVAIGTALAYFISPAWMALPGLVGAGLVFAGITDTCGMAILLSKMPWNRR